VVFLFFSFLPFSCYRSIIRGAIIFWKRGITNSTVLSLFYARWLIPLSLCHVTVELFLCPVGSGSSFDLNIYFQAFTESTADNPSIIWVSCHVITGGQNWESHQMDGQPAIIIRGSSSKSMDWRRWDRTMGLKGSARAKKKAGNSHASTHVCVWSGEVIYIFVRG